MLTFYEIHFSAEKSAFFISGLTTKKLVNYEKMTKQAKFVQRKTEVRSCNHRYR
jgi:hypothetical protein